MSTNYDDLAFDEAGGDLIVSKQLLNGTYYAYPAATAFEFQENGVMFEYLEEGTPLRIFLPYRVIEQIYQTV